MDQSDLVSEIQLANLKSEITKSDQISMILLPFDSSHRDESNDMCFISIAPILME
uniref:Uncharacterized protein n=1 Tax=Rhizophagus irregularis (strain DAOM 181602 / DAOM 197198 / MUCL 43194) TaxID=747089 RepID=U9UBP3_RHIID